MVVFIILGQIKIFKPLFFIFTRDSSLHCVSFRMTHREALLGTKQTKRDLSTPLHFGRNDRTLPIIVLAKAALICQDQRCQRSNNTPLTLSRGNQLNPKPKKYPQPKSGASYLSRSGIRQPVTDNRQPDYIFSAFSKSNTISSIVLWPLSCRYHFWSSVFASAVMLPYCSLKSVISLAAS